MIVIGQARQHQVQGNLRLAFGMQAQLMQMHSFARLDDAVNDAEEMIAFAVRQAEPHDDFGEEGITEERAGLLERLFCRPIPARDIAARIGGDDARADGLEDVVGIVFEPMEVLIVLLHLLVEPGVFDGDACLVDEGREQAFLFAGDRIAAALVVGDDHADAAVLAGQDGRGDEGIGSQRAGEPLSCR